VTHLHSRTLIFTWNRNQKKSVVNLASSLDTFKNRLHRFWGNQDVKYDYTAELTGAGSRSEFYMIKNKLLYIKFDYYDTDIKAVNSLRPWNIIDLA